MSSVPGRWRVEAGGSGITGHPQLFREFMAILRYRRLYLRDQKRA